MAAPHRVLIVGGGFGGLKAAKALGGDPRFQVCLVDRRNFHLFQPLLYQVATGGLSPADIAVPLRSVLAQAKNVEVLLDEVTDGELESKQLFTPTRRLGYDTLILACGARDTYFGHDEWAPFAPSLKSLEQATEIRRRILRAYELAEAECGKAEGTPLEESKRRALLTFAVVGGGPTGVELAGALAEISRTTLREDFRHIDPSSSRVILVEAGPRILPALSEKSSLQAARDLEQLGVELRMNSKVLGLTEEGLIFENGLLPARTVLWAAGVRASALNAKLGVALDRSGRILVDECLRIPSHPEVFVIGDQAAVKGVEKRQGVEAAFLPGLAPVAMQEGAYVAALIKKQADPKTDSANEKMLPFRYLDKGQMATIGRRRAVVEIGRVRIHGVFAWLAWLFIHIYYLIGFRNRLFVMAQWAWSYVTFSRGARLILGEDAKARP